jgi:hypothetical protein
VRKKIPSDLILCVFSVCVILWGLSFSRLEVQADPIIDFGLVAPTAGTISYAGGTAPLFGTNIQVDNVVGLDTPDHNGWLRNLDGGTLDFETGDLIGSDASHWTFGGGGSITLTGGVDLDNNGSIGLGDIPLGTTLLSGTFNGAEIIAFGNTFKIAGASFSDAKNAQLADFYGLTSPLYSGSFNISFVASGIPPSGFQSSTVLGGDVVNSPAQVPEPASLMLMGSGIIAMAAKARARRIKK